MIRAITEEERYLTKFTNGTGAGFADASAAQGGTGTSFRPHELLEAALATCVNVALRMYAAKNDIPLEEVVTEVTLDSTSSDETLFHYEVELSGPGLTSEHRAKLLEVAKGCTVRRALSKPIRFELVSIEEEGSPTTIGSAQSNNW